MTSALEYVPLCLAVKSFASFLTKVMNCLTTADWSLRREASGERRQDQIKNMIASISTGIIAPVELIARKAH